MEGIEVLASQAPYMTGQGNHERDFAGSGNSIGSGDSGGGELVVYVFVPRGSAGIVSCQILLTI